MPARESVDASEQVSIALRMREWRPMRSKWTMSKNGHLVWRKSRVGSPCVGTLTLHTNMCRFVDVGSNIGPDILGGY